VADRILASPSSSSTQLASFHYTDEKRTVDPIEEGFLTTLQGPSGVDEAHRRCWADLYVRDENLDKFFQDFPPIPN